MKTILVKHTIKTDPNPGTPDHIKALLEKDTPLEKIEVVDLEKVFYSVDVNKEPTIVDEAWANQFESKAEAFWYGQDQYRKDVLDILFGSESD